MKLKRGWIALFILSWWSSLITQCLGLLTMVSDTRPWHQLWGGMVLLHSVLDLTVEHKSGWYAGKILTKMKQHVLKTNWDYELWIQSGQAGDDSPQYLAGGLRRQRRWQQVQMYFLATRFLFIVVWWKLRLISVLTSLPLPTQHCPHLPLRVHRECALRFIRTQK